VRPDRWFSVEAHCDDGRIVDVTEHARSLDGHVFPSELELLTGIRASRWMVLTSALEYDEIPPEGYPNGFGLVYDRSH
jgi:hypothetical protein